MAKACAATAVPSLRGRVGSVQRGLERAVIDACIDDVDSWDMRSGCRVDVDLVAAIDEPGREVGQERLRTAAVRLPQRCHERSDERQPHAEITL